MKLNVQLFAGAKQAADCDLITVDVDDDATAADVVAAIGKASPSLAPLLPSCRLAVDCSYVSWDTRVTSSQELALIPPVSGG